MVLDGAGAGGPGGEVVPGLSGRLLGRHAPLLLPWVRLGWPAGSGQAFGFAWGFVTLGIAVDGGVAAV